MDQRISRVFREVVENMPYNSITPLLNVNHQKSPQKFGDNCIGQAEKVRRELKKIGYNNSFFLVDGRHHAIITQTHKAMYFLDPYLMHKEPINLTKIMMSKYKKGEYEAYPSARGPNGKTRKGYVNIIFQDETKFILKKRRYNVKKKKYTIARFLLDLKKPIYQEGLNNKKIALHPEQTTLSLRVLAKEKVAHVVYPVSKFRGEKVSRDKVYIKTNNQEIINYNNASFERELSKIANKLKTSSESILKFVLKGARTYEKLAPKKMKYFPSNPSNI